MNTSFYMYSVKSIRYDSRYVCNGVAIVASVMLTYSWLKSIDILFFTACVIPCIQTLISKFSLYSVLMCRL